MAEELKLNHVNLAIKKKFRDKKLIFGRGLVGSKIVFVTEVPGLEETAQNKPITGHAEKLLYHLLRSVGIDKNKVYITNVVKYHQPDRSMTAKEIKSQIPFLKEEIKSVGPKIVVTLGNAALNGIGLRQPLDNIHGNTVNFGSYELLPTFHPESALKNPQIRALLEADFIKLKELIRAK